MTSWNLDPATIRAVLANIENDRDELMAAVREQDMAAIEQGLSWGGPFLEPLRAAVLALVAQQSDDLMTVRDHVVAGLYGLTHATHAYEAGNEEMAAAVQQEMLSTAESGDFSYFILNEMTD